MSFNNSGWKSWVNPEQITVFMTLCIILGVSIYWSFSPDPKPEYTFKLFGTMLSIVVPALIAAGKATTYLHNKQQQDAFNVISDFKNYFTIQSVAGINSCDCGRFDETALSEKSEEMHLPKMKVGDAWSYHCSVWKSIYPDVMV